MRVLASFLLVLSLSPAARAQDIPPDRKLELYDIQDLISARRDFPMVEVPPAERRSGVWAATEGGDHPADSFVTAVRALLSLPSAAGFEAGLLSVRATEEEHKNVRELLAVYRRRLERLVTVEARFIAAPAALREASREASVVRIPAAEADLLLRNAEAAKAQIVLSPRMTLYDGQKAFIFVGEERSYVREYRLVSGPSGGLRPDPVSELSKTGATLEVRAAVKNAEADEVLLDDVQILLAEPREREKVRTTQTPYGPVEDPEVQTVRVSLRSSLKAGERLLVGPLSRPWTTGEDPKLWVLLRSTIVR